ncbi:chemotaxis protein CheW [Teredinibacter turnerae]|uniref:chemotaxis protein CheW n=1 Tax=Teredinibacter turnerae TaxID=2426 RepID=UPI00037A0C30|nr:chemotaxis protein CheW [Teredinibacter turnerae]
MQANANADSAVAANVANAGDGISPDSHQTDQYLTFIMAGEEYGVDILCVQEIRGWESATPLPNAPAHIKGVINLRGTIVPIVDLRQCFGMEAIDYTPVTVVIVLKVKSESSEYRVMGIVVDAVSDVYSLGKKDMRPPPDLSNAVNTDFVKGLVNVEDKMVILLDIDELLTLEDVPNLANVAKQIQSSVG